MLLTLELVVGAAEGESDEMGVGADETVGAVEVVGLLDGSDETVGACETVGAAVDLKVQ